jgi:hypothetical protein
LQLGGDHKVGALVDLILASERRGKRQAGKIRALAHHDAVQLCLKRQKKTFEQTDVFSD